MYEPEILEDGENTTPSKSYPYRYVKLGEACVAGGFGYTTTIARFSSLLCHADIIIFSTDLDKGDSERGILNAKPKSVVQHIELGFAELEALIKAWEKWNEEDPPKQTLYSLPE